jgi:hypothetical protein
MSTLWGCAFEDLVSAGRAERNVAEGGADMTLQHRPEVARPLPALRPLDKS